MNYILAAREWDPQPGWTSRRCPSGNIYSWIRNWGGDPQGVRRISSSTSFFKLSAEVTEVTFSKVWKSDEVYVNNLNFKSFYYRLIWRYYSDTCDDKLFRHETIVGHLSRRLERGGACLRKMNNLFLFYSLNYFSFSRHSSFLWQVQHSALVKFLAAVKRDGFTTENVETLRLDASLIIMLMLSL